MATQRKNRLDTTIESEGAEFLALAHLLIEGIPTYKTYTKMPGYDLFSVNIEMGTSCRIQVKCRYATNYDGTFPIKIFNSDFVIFVELNRGIKRQKMKEIDKEGQKPTRIFIFPTGRVKQAMMKNLTTWKKANIQHIPSYDSYLNRWDLIQQFLLNKTH